MKFQVNFAFLLVVSLKCEEILVKACTPDELVMLQIISRHGDISPIELYPKDPNDVEIWKEGLNDLTMLGKFQPYALGSFFRSLYEGFITSDPTEVKVMSASNPYCVKSAQSLLASLYAPNPYWEVVRNFSWQPIYIEQDDESSKKYLSKPLCLAAETEYEKVLQEQEVAIIWQVYQFLGYYWQENSGRKINGLSDVEALFNILASEAAYNLTIPNWALNYWDDLQFLHDVSFGLKLKTKLLQRLRGGPLVELTIDRMKKKTSGDLGNTKVLVFSSHDSNIAGFLSAVGMWNGIKPGPCATVLIELYNHSDTHFVRYLYLNSTSPERAPQTLHLLQVPGCSEFCPLDYVIEKTLSTIPKNWETECQME